MFDTLNIALFGDLHGRLLLSFWLGKRWEEEHGEVLDYALCVGDAGVYRSVHAMDKASRRWAEKFPEELGFSKFFMDIAGGRIVENPLAAQVLDQVGFDLLFVPGNHEEHPYLARLQDEFARSAEVPIAVDTDWEGLAAGRYAEGQFPGFGRIKVLPQGKEVLLDGPADKKSDWEPAFQASLVALNGIERYTPEDAWSGRGLAEADVLLTHDSYAGRFRDGDFPERLETAGSQRLLDYIRRTGPRRHFSGHHHRFCPEVLVNNDHGKVTRSIGLNQVMFRDKGEPITQGSFGILRVRESGDSTFEVVRDEWYKRLRYSQVSAFM